MVEQGKEPGVNLANKRLNVEGQPQRVCVVIRNQTAKERQEPTALRPSGCDWTFWREAIQGGEDVGGPWQPVTTCRVATGCAGELPRGRRCERRSPLEMAFRCFKACARRVNR